VVLRYNTPPPLATTNPITSIPIHMAQLSAQSRALRPSTNSRSPFLEFQIPAMSSLHLFAVFIQPHMYLAPGNAGGDSFLTICLWELGFAHTTPDPLWHPAGLQMFDPSPSELNPDDFIVWKASHILGNMLQEAAGVCRGLCRVRFLPSWIARSPPTPCTLPGSCNEWCFRLPRPRRPPPSPMAWQLA